MPRNGSGTMSVTNSFSSGTTISSSEMNANFTDFASEVTNSLPRDGQAAMTGQLKVTAGTAAAPGVIFSTDTDTGVFRAGANQLGVSVGGSSVGKFTSNGWEGGALTASGENYDAFASGTEMLFYESSAPTGWTAGGLNDLAIRVVNTGGGTIGGSTAFSSVFGARTITQANLPNVNLTAASDGAHSHYIANTDETGSATLSSSNIMQRRSPQASDFSYDAAGSATAATVGGTSSNGAHTHTVPLGGSGTAMDFDVSYANFLSAVKD